MKIPLRIRLIVFLVFLFLIFFGSKTLVSLYANWLWFSEVGYQEIFSKVLITKLAIGIPLMIIYFLIIWGNLKIAQSSSKKDYEWQDNKTILLNQITDAPGKVFRVLTLVALFLSFALGSGGIAQWREFLLFFNPTSFGMKDPIFQYDLSFYVFQYPVYRILVDWLYTALIFSTIGSLIIYFLNQTLTFFGGQLKWNKKIMGHLSILLGLFVVVKICEYRLNMYELLYSSHGVSFGASYTDVHARLMIYKLLTGFGIIAAIIMFANVFRKKMILPLATIGVWFVLSFILQGIYPEIIQRFIVTPNEISKEKPYIESNIKFTNWAYGLDKIEEKSYPASENLTREAINRNAPTIKNIRLWDTRPLLDTYKQIQVIRQYYNFLDVDVDRYQLGNESLQVMLAAREISVPPSARTWTNEKLSYTHGYGVAMTRVNAVEAEGLPKLMVKDIPPISPDGLKIDRPEIYFGESQQSFILVKTKEKEFNYPKGNENVYTTYEGTAGIPISSTFRKGLFAWLFGSTDLFFTSRLTPESRILFHRNIRNRAETIMPFLTYETDPYIVISEGKLYWIIDGYTETDKIPYSQPFNNDFNYLRNSVKIIIDAYNGTTKYYVIDPQDPLIQSWNKIFPNSFLPLDKMPVDLKAHLRYPERLFKTQASMYSIYHMREAQIFYNKEDTWDIPNEIFGSDQVPVEPYYVIMHLPGEEKEQFMVMVPFTPHGKDNMISWMAAKCDFPEYGKLIVYKFPKDKLVFGPMQIESKINQDPVISGQLSLWNQQGSRVIRGNLLVIPIEDSILYVEPLYLKSEQSQIPELKRVLVCYGERIAMEPTLEEALASVFGGKSITASVEPKEAAITQPAGTTTQSPAMKDMAHQASQYYDKAQEKLKAGDWSGYGTEMQKLRDTLKQMERTK